MSILSDHCKELQGKPFFEPVSVFVINKGEPELLYASAQLLTSWTQHIFASTLCRMRSLEGPIGEHLLAGSTLAALILLRSHFEAASMAAYCLEQLTDASRQKQLSLLSKLIPKTLFGTSLKKHREKESVADLLTLCEGDTIRICSAVASLDKFYFQEAAEGRLAVVYSILCEFAHPNHRGVLDFMQSVRCDDGWLISYMNEEPPNPKMRAHALETLLVSMRCGYAAVEMLRSWRFSQRGEEVDWHGPSESDAEHVWVRFMQREADSGIQ
ncbi:MAG: hypothetical protein HYZ37_06200 [Candidatus Solibacter usitatus]|nr:hypothetical protein [Candidatus Solibacter usitatus]